MKIKVFRIIIALIIFINMAFIFGFSNQNGKQSTEISKKLSIYIIKIIDKQEINDIDIEKLNKTEHIIRKIAHFFIYMLMSFWLISFINTYKMRYKTKIVLCTIIGIAYASLDEFHQSFILGRTALISDIIIDTVGILVGIIFFLTIVKIVKYRGNHR